MSLITLKNASGKDAGTVDLDDGTFGIEPNVAVMHQVVTAQLAARRAGTQSTKTRSEVRGGGAKPYRQKGTGNARQGSIRAPQYSGGGVALGPKPRSYAQKTPKKMIGLALRSALSDRNAEGKVIVVDQWGFDAPSTKSAKSALADLGVTGKILVVVDRDDAVAALSFRNLPEVQLIAPTELNAYDILCNDVVVFTQSTLPSPAAPPRRRSTTTASSAETTADEASTVAVVTVAVETVNEVETATDDSPSDAATVQGFAAVDTANAAVGGEAVHPYGAGSHAALADGAQPEGYAIKGNADSMLYHLPRTSFYDRTVAEVWFDVARSAESAGFTRPESQVGDDAPEFDAADDTGVPVQPHGAGSYVALAGDVRPEGFEIKGNADSMLYHTPDSAFHGRTVAEVWFATEDAAEAAGFSRPASQQDANEESDEA